MGPANNGTRPTLIENTPIVIYGDDHLAINEKLGNTSYFYSFDRKTVLSCIIPDKKNFNRTDDLVPKFKIFTSS